MKMLVIALLASCATNTPQITQDEYDDVAQSVASSTAATAGDVGAMGDAVLLATGNLPLGFRVDADGTFGGSHFGIDYHYALVCYDVTGTKLAVCNPSSQHADIDLSWGGMIALPGFTAAVSRAGSWSLAGLREPKIILAGIGSFTYDSTVTNATRTRTVAYHFTYDATYTHVLIDKATRLAIDGTIDYAIDATKMVDNTTVRSFTLDAEVTLHADATATIVLDGIHIYVVNLVTGAVTAPSPA